MKPDYDMTPGEASQVAIHKAQSAQMAVEQAREAQLQEAIRKTAEETKAALLEGLREVFGEGDEKRDPDQMKILVRRIPLICQDVKQINKDISTINDNIKWGVRLVLGAVILALVALVIQS